MHDSLAFETPENVQVRYRPAGLGTRFVAWFVDQIFVSILLFISLLFLAIAAASFGSVLETWVDFESTSPEEIGGYVMGILFILFGLGSFAYFTLLELLMGGQTIGKRLTGIRVVKVDGFALDAVSILVRNVFRVIDNFPVMWLFPVLSPRSQRAGDMVSGTVVVSDEAPELTEVRVQLSHRTALDAEFRFDSNCLQRLNENDFEAVERLLDRWDAIPESQRQELTERLTGSLAFKMQIPSPPPERAVRFLEDLLAAELRRQNRLLS